MVIGVDAGALSITDERLKVGVWRVTFNLLRELAKLDGKNEYRLYSFQPIDRGVMAGFGKRMHNVVITPRAGWSTIRLPIELRLRPVDVFLGLAQALPASPSYSIGFIYDLGFLFHPKAYGTSAKKLKKQTGNLVKRATHIITISESSKRDILAHYGLGKERVTVAYPGVDERFTPAPGKKPKIPYFLFVGSLNKAKDLSLALEAFALFLKQTKKPYDFLLIGGDYWPDPAINASIHRCKLNNRVKKLGFVPDEQLGGYYRGATAFVTTALREGFCLPAAEAMACATPVVAVDRGSLKEVMAEGGLIASVPNAAEVALLLCRIAEDEKLRETLGSKVIKRAKMFSWKTFAETVYQQINMLTHEH